MKTLYLGNDWRIRLRLTDSETGDGAVGLTVRGFFSTARDGLVAIDPSVEVAALEEEGDGWYEAILDGAVLRVALIDYSGKALFERHISEQGYDGFTTVYISAVRPE